MEINKHFLDEIARLGEEIGDPPRTWVDPPSGWKYGFPKSYIVPPVDFNAWLINNGYPPSEIDRWVNREVPCRFWKEEDL